MAQKKNKKKTDRNKTKRKLFHQTNVILKKKTGNNFK